MNWQEYIIQDRIHNRAIITKKVYVDICEDFNAATILSQVVYWNTPPEDSDDFEKGRLNVILDGKYVLVKGRSDWYDEIRLSPKSYDRAIQILIDLGLVSTSVARFYGTPKTHILLHRDKLAELVLLQITKNKQVKKIDSGCSPKGNINIPQRSTSDIPQRSTSKFPKGESPYTSITSSITSKNTTSSDDVQNFEIPPHDENEQSNRDAKIKLRFADTPAADSFVKNDSIATHDFKREVIRQIKEVVKSNELLQMCGDMSIDDYLHGFAEYFAVEGKTIVPKKGSSKQEYLSSRLGLIRYFKEWVNGGGIEVEKRKGKVTADNSHFEIQAERVLMFGAGVAYWKQNKKDYRSVSEAKREAHKEQVIRLMKSGVSETDLFKFFSVIAFMGGYDVDRMIANYYDAKREVSPETSFNPKSKLFAEHVQMYNKRVIEATGDNHFNILS